MAQQLASSSPEERKKPSSLHRYNKIEMLPPTAKDISFGSAFANGGTANGGTATGGNGSGSQDASSGKPQQELPALTHQYAEQYVYAYPAAPAYGGPPKPPPAPMVFGFWDEPARAYGGGRYRPPQLPYYHGGGRGGYGGAGAGGYSYHGGGGCGYPPTAGGGGGGGHGVSNEYGGPPQQKPHMSAGWLAAGAATAYGAYQHHMRKHHGGGGHGYRHGHGGYDDGSTCGGDGYGYGCRGCAPHMHMRGEFEHQEHTNIKYSVHPDGKCNDAASGPLVTMLDK
ncbi:hypothetical protein VPH35_121764 [Triticum aestivum]